jgi:D-amino-acid dehydrogenase
MKKISIIGGGIVGQFIAYYLSKAGHQVTVIDDAPAMPPASAGNCGLISPSHILPLNTWGTLIKGLKWMGQKDAPLAIKPQLSTSFATWFASYIWHCRQSEVEKSIGARHLLLQLSWRLYEEILATESLDCDWQKGGLIYGCRTQEGISAMNEEVQLLQKHGLAARSLTQDELHAQEPLFQPDVIGGAIFECDGWLMPGKLLENLTALNKQNGVQMITARASRFKHTNGRIDAIQLESDEHTAEEYILAAGAQSVFLARPLGIDLKLIPGKGYNLTVHSPLLKQPTIPVYMVERKVVATPWTGGFRLGSTMEFTGYDLSLSTHRLEALKRAAGEYLQIDISNVDFTPWAGWRPMTSNGLPVIGRAPKYQNLILATGHGMLGLSMAPATGHLVADILGKGSPEVLRVA